MAFERLQKPFLTVETGEAYQPIRLTYQLLEKNKLVEALSKLKCIERKAHAHSWNWLWKDECDDLHFESLDTFQKKVKYPLRLATLSIHEGKLFINLASFKRACLAVPFFFKVLGNDIAKIDKADFINKVFGLGERLPHGFAELFKEEELEKIVQQRLEDYEQIQARCEQASTADEALTILSEYTQNETKKRLPYAERYSFTEAGNLAPDIIFLGFYIFLRARELVAIRRWMGESGYNLDNSADETIAEVFGEMGLDLLEN